MISFMHGKGALPDPSIPHAVVAWMKKLYQEPAWQAHSRRRQRKAVASARRAPRRRFQSTLNTTPNTGVRLVGTRTTLDVPAVFSLSRNINDNLRFFNSVLALMRSGTDIDLNLSHLEHVDSDALAYLLSVLEFRRTRGFSGRIRGNTPSDSACNEMLRATGFYAHLQLPGAELQVSRPDIYAIRSGVLVDPAVAAELKHFTINRLGVPDSRDLRSLYSIVLECMDNTVHHAYRRQGAFGRRWWVMASLDVAQHRIKYTFIDNGLSIPATVRKNLLERARTVLPYDVRKAHDHELILSALRGELRTATRLPYRGKGLPSMRAACDKGLVNNLRIISRSGEVNYSSGSSTALDYGFRGTLVAWEMTATARS